VQLLAQTIHEARIVFGLSSLWGKSPVNPISVGGGEVLEEGKTGNNVLDKKCLSGRRGRSEPESGDHLWKGGRREAMVFTHL